MERATKSLISNLKKQKRDKSLLFLDNVKIIKDNLDNKNLKIEYILTSLDELPFKTTCRVYRVDERTIEILSDTKHHRKYYALHTTIKMLWLSLKITFWFWTDSKTREMWEHLFELPKQREWTLCFWWTL